MNIPIKYRFFLQIEDGERQPSRPIYKDDTAIDLTQETNQRFFRRALTNKIDFIMDDYDFIMSASFGDTIYLWMEISTDYGQSFSPYWRCKFVITDCTIDYDNKKISVQPSSADSYTTVLEGAEREFNLIDLQPALQGVRMALRPFMQTYILGDTKILNTAQGLSWEMDCNEERSRSKLTGDYHFGFDSALIRIDVSGSPDYGNDVLGTYIGQSQHWNWVVHGDNDLTATDKGIYVNVDYRYDTDNVLKHFVSIISPTSLVLYQYKTTNADNLYEEFTFENVGSTGTVIGKIDDRLAYTRLVCNVDKVGDADTYDRPASDITDYDLKYDRLLPITSSGGNSFSVRICDRFSDEPTKWGKREKIDEYYLPPDIPGSQYMRPLSTHLWNEVSYWVADKAILFDELASDIRWMNDAYTIDSTIAVLLNQIAPELKHEATTAYSEFLYSPINPISGNSFKVFLTQKTNILKGIYSEPARKAMTTFTQVMNILKNTFGLYWFVDGDKLRIEHISWFMNGGSYSEDMREIGYDLTAMKNIRNGKTWDYGQNVVSYDKDRMARFYKYEWMDAVTTPFEGMQIEVKNNATDGAKTETMKVDNVCTDVDYMLMYPSNFSNDGFAMLIATPADALITKGHATGVKGSNNDQSAPLYVVDGRTLQYSGVMKLTVIGSGQAKLSYFDHDGNYLADLSTATIDSTTTQVTTLGLGASADLDNIGYIGFVMFNGSLDFYVESLLCDSNYQLPMVELSYTDMYGVEWHRDCQNGLGAMVYLQDNFLTYQMPASSILVNGVLTTAKGLAKRKSQDVVFPAGVVDVDTNKLVKTVVGIGEIGKISLNLSSRIIKATLRHDTD